MFIITISGVLLIVDQAMLDETFLQLLKASDMLQLRSWTLMECDLRQSRRSSYVKASRVPSCFRGRCRDLLGLLYMNKFEHGLSYNPASTPKD